jgi:hypothetical protein
MRALSLLPLALALAARLDAQPNTVVLNEVNFFTAFAPDQWIEIANLGDAPADLSTWSIYYATHTPMRPGNYWWAFPPSTILPARSFLRIRWGRAIQAAPPPGVIDTGDTVFHFLFGLGFEPLYTSYGALGLFDTQANNEVNDPARIRDFMAWGSAGQFRREDLAIQANRWVAGDRIPFAFNDTSIAFAGQVLGEPTRATEFFRDRSPTPGAGNTSNEIISLYGQGCAIGQAADALRMDVTSYPTPGNVDFNIRVGGFRAMNQVNILVLIFGDPIVEGIQLPGTPCRIYVDHFMALGFPVTQTPFLFSPGLEGARNKLIAMQAIGFVGSSVSDLVMSNGLYLRVGNQ